eukprot:snap_masked-scaffold_28-processed-gene-3.31-mRNA-1 protein AED:1.00 eAED:1.00 QI:0/-1/0/0/-1/1/1/0/287
MLGQVIEELDAVFEAKTKLWQSKVWEQEDFEIPDYFTFDGQKFAVTLDKKSNRISVNANRFEAQYYIFPKLSRPLYYDLKDLSHLKEFIMKNGLMFQGAILDPPWKLAGDSPVRGPAITYPQLSFDEIPLRELISIVKNGYVFLWVIHNVEQQVRKLLEDNNWHVVETITWIKLSRNGKVSSSIGPYFNRGKETCLMIQVGGKPSLQVQSNFGVDVIMEPRREQSRKPQKLYEMIETAFTTDARFIEFFGKPWNCRNRWVTVGLEIPRRFSLQTEYDDKVLEVFKET